MKKITLYTSPTCVFCPLVAKTLKEQGVEYEEIDISESREAMEEMRRKTGQIGVPVTVIGDEIITGFNKKKILKLLKKP